MIRLSKRKTKQMTILDHYIKNITPAIDVPFKILSFPQYLAANMNKLPLTRAAVGTVTLQEAAQTGAERLVTVCHYCNQTFAAESARYDFSVDSYVNLVAEARYSTP